MILARYKSRRKRKRDRSFRVSQDEKKGRAVEPRGGRFKDKLRDELIKTLKLSFLLDDQRCIDQFGRLDYIIE